MDERALAAQTNSGEVDALLQEYLPMIKRQVLNCVQRGQDYEDLLSCGMLAFANAIHQYQPHRGSFLHFARMCIHSRVIDELRKSGKGRVVVFPLDGNEPEAEGGNPIEAEASLLQYSREMERQNLTEEIAALQQELLRQNISFDTLARVSPRQKRSRSLCAAAAQCVLEDTAMRSYFEQNAHLMPAELAARLGVSAKTIEQHRRYIVVLLVILRGDYPCIRAFLPKAGEVKT